MQVEILPFLIDVKIDGRKKISSLWNIKNKRRYQSKCPTYSL